MNIFVYLKERYKQIVGILTFTSTYNVDEDLRIKLLNEIALNHIRLRYKSISEF